MPLQQNSAVASNTNFLETHESAGSRDCRSGRSKRYASPPPLKIQKGAFKKPHQHDARNPICTSCYKVQVQARSHQAQLIFAMTGQHRSFELGNDLHFARRPVRYGLRMHYRHNQQDWCLGSTRASERIVLDTVAGRSSPLFSEGDFINFSSSSFS